MSIYIKHCLQFAVLVLGAGLSRIAHADFCDSSVASLRVCQYDSPHGDDTVALKIVQESDGTLFAELELRTADVRFHRVRATVYLQQCRGDGTACGTLHATSTGPSDVNWANGSHLGPSPGTASFGHIYRACGSFADDTIHWTNLLNVCSPFLAN